MALAVMAMMGVLRPAGSWRIARVACNPSITGICMSIRTRSNAGPVRMASTACCPLFAVLTWNPTSSSISQITCWLISLSSTTRMRRAWLNLRSSVSATLGAATAGAGWGVGLTEHRSAIRSDNTTLLTGLTSTPANAMALAWASTSSRPKAVTSTSCGTVCSPSARMAVAVARPSISGICQSSSTTR